jgi:chromosome segregation ATPase
MSEFEDDQAIVQNEAYNRISDELKKRMEFGHMVARAMRIGLDEIKDDISIIQKEYKDLSMQVAKLKWRADNSEAMLNKVDSNFRDVFNKIDNVNEKVHGLNAKIRDESNRVVHTQNAIMQKLDTIAKQQLADKEIIDTAKVNQMWLKFPDPQKKKGLLLICVSIAATCATVVVAAVKLLTK